MLTPADIEALADVPPREVLLARLAGGFQAPMMKAAGLFQAFTRNVAYGFKALIDQRVEGGEAPPPAEPKRPPRRTAPTEAEATAAAEARRSPKHRRSRGSRRRPKPASRPPAESPASRR